MKDIHNKMEADMHQLADKEPAVSDDSQAQVQAVGSNKQIASEMSEQIDSWLEDGCCPKEAIRSVIEWRDALLASEASTVQNAQEPTKEQIHEWLVENCGRGLPYAEASDLPTALHGLSYVLRQIEGTSKYMVNIGQAGPASTSIRWILEHIAKDALIRNAS